MNKKDNEIKLQVMISIVIALMAGIALYISITKQAKDDKDKH